MESARAGESDADMSLVNGRLPVPASRGPWSRAAMELLRGGDVPEQLPDVPTDPLSDDDFQLALYLLHEVHYRGLEGISDDMEWNPGLIGFRNEMIRAFERAIRDEVPAEGVDPASIPERLRDLDAQSAAPLARHLWRKAPLWQFEEFVVHRSAYHLKEADPHTFAIPRLGSAAKSAIAQIQSDEYGAGDPERMHSNLFGRLMSGLGLRTEYGHYVHLIPGITLATVNLLSMFGLNRRWRGAAVGHLALFELGSSQPNRMYGDGLRRLGFGADVTEFNDEHVEADAIHAMLATYDLAGRLALDEPELAEDIWFGARALDAIEGLAGVHMLERWNSGATSLLQPLSRRREVLSRAS